MFTTCPACRMNLAVTAADLRIGQGYVRCGRCERVFNALMSLAEDLDPEEQSGLAAHGTASVPAIEFDGDARAQAAAGQDDSPSGSHERPDRSLDIDLDVMDSAATGTVETIVLEGDTYTQVEEHIGEEEMLRRLRDITGEPHPAAAEVEVAAEPQVEVELDADAAVGNPPRRHWGWAAAVAGLALLLVGQLVHHGRQALVTNAWLESPMKGLYGLFGVTLEPEWDLDDYELRQLGGEALALNSTTLVLRATVQNRAPGSQPPPLIRVRLQDRYGNTLSTTAVPPSDYLRTTAPKRMAADERLDAELHLEDPNRQATSWDLDACLPTVDGKLHCASDK
jgi:predicted Zn finger-like uncharacterized protein